MEGTIIRIVSNAYTVLNTDHKTVLCVCKGKLRLGVTPRVGDHVVYHKEDHQGIIETILERKNSLVRPAIANVDQALVVMSAKDPNFDSVLVDRLCMLIRHAQIEPILCITKRDLLTEKDTEILTILQEYAESGRKIVYADHDTLTQNLVPILRGKISVLTGQSGVGKSSLLNVLDPTFELNTQAISKALGRGKHTTRHVELHEVEGGWVADTPGFSSLDMTTLSKEELPYTVDEFLPYLGHCGFNDCLHEKEPHCAIKEAVAKGLIPQRRYDHYLEVLQQIKQRKEKY